MPDEPGKVTVRMYNVGFGDCFLVTFHYAPPLKDQHILIDFGSVSGSVNMKQIALQIRDACGGKLYAVVATHRHKDHIGGFSDAGGTASPGAIIASCKPEVVLQPWTENPDAGADASSAALLQKNQPGNPLRLFFASMNAMQAYAQAVVDAAPLWRGADKRPIAIERLAGNNTSNPDAVRNLRKMGKRPPRFLQYGSPSGLEDDKLLPGVKVTVLGPPALKQQNLKKYAKQSDEYWLASKFWGLQQRAAATVGKFDLFPRDARYGKGPKPLQTRWFIEHAESALKKNALAIVTILDKFLNNTSLILLFEVKGKKLLFPGDAQLENWQWALSQEGIQDMLKDVDLYKVGHHGSRNATPKELWNRFEKRRGRALTTMMSTATGVYGRSEDSKVPSANLVKALKNESTLLNTQDLKGGKDPIVLEVECL
jgi:hypothetical protein